ncbi:hypothetical protein LZ30DRAFT_825586 [Colletotrichum cereale]|nr:hypothetical protein LZ30DRAFT_825586 [Colletotrichum cereale]
MPFIANLSHVFGRRLCLLISVASFSLGTIFCCVSDPIGLMLLSRTSAVPVLSSYAWSSSPILFPCDNGLCGMV